KAISPFLGSGLTLLKKKPATKTGKETLYLASPLPPEEWIKESLLAQNPKKPLAMKALAADVPLCKAEFLAVFNQMLDAGQLQVTRIDDKFGMTGLRVPASGFGTAALSPSPAFHNEADDDAVFRAAFEVLDCGRLYVRICNLRRELGWSVERFNAHLCKLRADGTIQLHAGDVSTMTEEDIRQSYKDANNFFYATLTWKK
ncbi:MAG: hypothetical protein FWD31_14615, partial [Planctomycetaceae bacterium]|nr:hypothetical protein [Planctomycetaceae bacterium]